MKRALILTLLITQFACADNLTFHGKLINPPACTINNGETLEVSFGSVIIDNIDGVNYLTEIPWTLTCDSSFRDDALTFTLSYLGTATPYSANALTTNVPELGIELQQNGTVFPPGTSLTIDE
ncbi:fimbrial protein, partial [Salmonella enterica]|nr:fimbrial protein [Salmonella enterica]